MTRPIALPDYAARALAEGRLTQWRVRLKVQPGEGHSAHLYSTSHVDWQVRSKFGIVISNERLPFAPGDVRWVQETWAHDGHSLDDARRAIESDGHTMVCVRHKAGASKFDLATMRWRSPVTMPKWASRWTLAVESVRIERVQDATIAAAEDEGIEWVAGDHSRKESYARRWTARHGPGSWERNDWCAVATLTTSPRKD